MNNTIFQVSTLQALALGYTKPVLTVEAFVANGDTGLGTFEDVNGEMIVVDGTCYQASYDGTVAIPPLDQGVPFACVGSLEGAREFDLGAISEIDRLKDQLNLKVEEGFGLNSIHIARVDGDFELVRARSETPYHSQHVTLKEILDQTQTDFAFEHISGTLVCVYYPDYMDGINAPGWHLHFLSSDHNKGGHVFDLKMVKGHCRLKKMNSIHISLPTDAAFDTYSLKNASQDEIKTVEQGK